MQMTISDQQYDVKRASKKKYIKTSKAKVLPFPNTSEIRGYSLELVEHDFTVVNEFLIKEIVLKKQKNLEIHEHKCPEKGNIDSKESTYGKGSALAMSFNLPTPFLLFKNELVESFSGFSFKIFPTLILGFTLSFGNFDLSQLVNGLAILFIIALADALIGILPNTKIKGSKAKDHTLQAKALMFVVNVIGIVVFFAIHFYLQNALPNPNIFQKQIVNVHIYYSVWLAIIYSIRIANYTASANNTKVPKFFSTLLSYMNKK
ncbi:hypothetical protein LCL96_04110 [Rossellomorea aquimaris]|uniref:hypothetical protein n=1 Tax=Rossellomorea aquimaris TaxID=189382 RepID=UPI001CD722C5|nr:hypothetical protein [Rossellomorea aquimaris]MCA1058101.1 hypothetical protein [Rossellomorea aquimaris]